jgi:hypothetical protein
VALQAAQPFLQLGLPAGQADRGSQIAKVVQDGASDVGSGEGSEGCALLGVEPFGGPDQPDHPHLEQILHTLPAAAAVMDGDGSHQIPVGFNESIALLQGKASPQAAIGSGDGHEIHVEIENI